MKGPSFRPAEQDLEQLRTDAERRQTFVEVEGETSDVAQLHQYVAEIGRSALFASAQITSHAVTRRCEAAGPGRTLPLRLIVRAGHGSAAGACRRGAARADDEHEPTSLRRAIGPRR